MPRVWWRPGQAGASTTRGRKDTRLLFDRHVRIGFLISLLMLALMGVTSYRSTAGFAAAAARARATTTIIFLAIGFAFVILALARMVIHQEGRRCRIAEESLRGEHAQLMGVLQQMPAGVAIGEAPSGKVIFVNAAMERIFRRPFQAPGSIEEYGEYQMFRPGGKPMPDHEHPMSRALLAGEVVAGEEAPILRGDGTREIVSVSAAPVRDREGRITAAVVVVEDISERKQAEEALRQSEERFRRLVEGNIAGVIVADSERILEANDKFLQMMGYTRQDLEHGVFPWRDMTPPEHAVASEKALQEVLTRGACTPYEKEYFRKDGGRVPVLTGASLLTRDPLTWVWFVVDLTEQKRAAQVLFDFKVALDQHAIVAITDAPGKITYVNDRFCAISKYSREELIGQDHRIINSGHHSKAFFRKLWQTIMSGRTWRGLIKSRAKDGTFYWLDTTIVPFLDASGKPAQYITIRTDTTAREQAAKRIRQLNQDLRQKAGRLDDANRELEAFSYSVSHDLRAPLRHLEGFLALLESHIGGGLDEKGQHYLDTLLDSARQMGNLIDALLRFSRTGRVDMSSTKVGMADLVEQVLRELTADLRGRKIVWTVAPLPEVTGDPALLRQVLVNLLDNAIKYTRTRAEATIEIGCREEGEEWVFFVRDNGVGFDMRYVHKLFGVFQRLHGSGEFEGTGIGLATVQRIVGRHGGRAWAEGVVDHGATFYVSLPKWLSGEKDRFGREPAESITDREEQPS